MSWMMVSTPKFPQEGSVEQQLQDCLAAAHLAAPAAREIHMIAVDNQDSVDLFFSPSAVTLIRTILVAHGAKNSVGPPSDVSNSLLYGDPVK